MIPETVAGGTGGLVHSGSGRRGSHSPNSPEGSSFGYFPAAIVDDSPTTARGDRMKISTEKKMDEPYNSREHQVPITCGGNADRHAAGQSAGK